jgi:sarcosine oxidase subunit beta
MDMNEKGYDVIIIGAGIIGACTALELTRQGYRTLNVDKGPAAGYGSTSASCAIIRPYYSSLETCAIAYEGWYYWKDWAGYIGEPDPRGMITYHDTGCMALKTGKNGNFDSICAILDKLDYPYQHLTPDQMAEKLPFIDRNEYGPAKRPEDDEFGQPNGKKIVGGIYFERGGYVNDPALSAQNAEHAGKLLGASYLYGTAVTDIRRSGNQVEGVTLADGRQFDAPVVINIAGPHSSRINKMAGVFDGMTRKTRALRHEVAHAPAPAGFDFEKNGMVYSDSDISTYARPEVGNHVLVGSEDPDCDTREWVDPDDFNRDFTEQARIQTMRLAQRFSGLGITEHSKGVVDLYDVTDDWMPIYDKTDLNGFYVAIGTSGNQFKNAPVAAKIMAALIGAYHNGQDHDIDPVQFHLDHVNFDLSLDFLSRNREINPYSSFSVLG